MAQHDYFLDNQTAANYRTDHNNCLAAIVSNNSGDTEPSPTFAFQIWVDTSGANDVVKQRNAANDAWIELYQLTASAQSLADLSVDGNITVGGTVDGRDVAADGTKLDGIESGATADQTAAEILTEIKTVDGASSGLDADLLDGQEGTYYLDRANHTGTLASGTFSGTVTAADFTVTNGGTIEDTTGDYGSIKVTGGSTGGWRGYAIQDGAVFMQNNAQTQFGLYDDTNNHWAVYHVKNDKTSLFYDGTERIQTTSTGADITGDLHIDTELTITENSPQIHFEDTDHYDHWIHVNANNFYVLSDRNGDGTWETPYPLQLESDTNDAYIFGRRIIDNGAFNCDSGRTFNGELQVNGRLDVGNATNADHEIRIYKTDNNVSDHIQFYNGTTRVGEIGCEDTTWLRINQETAKNIYTPRYIRADGGFFVDGATHGINGSAYVRAANGNSSAPGLSFGSDTNTGVFKVTGDSLGFSAGGTRRGRLTGNTVEFPGVYDATTSGGTTVKVNSSGRLRRASSSRNVKTNIEPMEAAYATKLLNEAQPVWYRPRIPDPEYPQQYLDSLEENESPGIYECESFCRNNGIDWEVGDKWMNEGENPAHSHWGFIAEDLAEVDPRLCYLNPDTNTWDSVDYEKFTPVLLKLAQMQKEEITQTNSLLQTALTRIEALEAKVTALEAGSS